MADLPFNSLLNKEQLFQEFSGSLTESFIAQELITQQERLHYWTSEGRAEIDFIIQQENKIIPIEVKSGLTSRKKSLIFYKNKYNPELAIRFSPNNIDIQNGFLNLPIYCVMAIAAMTNGLQ